MLAVGSGEIQTLLLLLLLLRPLWMHLVVLAAMLVLAGCLVWMVLECLLQLLLPVWLGLVFLVL